MSKRNRARTLRVWEKDRGQKWLPGYHIHHCDGDKSNDDPENLQCLTEAFHRSISSRKKRKPRTPEHCAKISAAKKGKPLTAEHRASIGAAQLGKKRPHAKKLGPPTEEHRSNLSKALSEHWARVRENKDSHQ